MTVSLHDLASASLTPRLVTPERIEVALGDGGIPVEPRRVSGTTTAYGEAYELARRPLGIIETIDGKGRTHQLPVHVAPMTASGRSGYPILIEGLNHVDSVVGSERDAVALAAHLDQKDLKGAQTLRGLLQASDGTLIVTSPLLAGDLPRGRVSPTGLAKAGVLGTFDASAAAARLQWSVTPLEKTLPLVSSGRMFVSTQPQLLGIVGQGRLWRMSTAEKGVLLLARL